MTTYETDVNGKFIPATQRPDGTWRKARRVKDGYVPQEEVPLYESKAKKIQAAAQQRYNPASIPSLPVGMCPLVAQAVKEKQEKQLKKQQQKEQKQQEQQQQQQKTKVNPTPGLLNVTSKFEAVKKPKSQSQISELASKVEELTVNSGDDKQDVAKKLKKLRKKLREIEEIEQKIESGELAKPEKDQLDKVGRKSEVLAEIQELESSRKLVK